jgi:hypothetical protein
VVIVFEEAHWIDPTSRELLDLVVERDGSCRCCGSNPFPSTGESTGWVCTAAITIKVLNPSRSKGFAAAPAVEIWRAIVAKAAEELVRRDRRFANSPLEGDGFELPVPREKYLRSEAEGRLARQPKSSIAATAFSR